MKTLAIFFLICFFGITSGCVSDDDAKKSNGDSVDIPTQGLTSPNTYPGMTLVWSDEFDGSTLNEANWSHETGNGQNGWGNNELQFYRPQNTRIQDGHLVITAKKEAFGGREYTSSRIITKGKQQFRYGRVDIRASLPKGQGIWPALWMLGSNFDTVSWPACGEIDIMEMVGGNGRENTVHGTVHWEHDGKHVNFMCIPSFGMQTQSVGLLTTSNIT